MIDETTIASIVAEVLKNIQQQSHNGTIATAATACSGACQMRADQAVATTSRGDKGIYRDLNAAIHAAKRAQQELVKLSLKTRGEIVAAIRRAAIENVATIARLAHEETGYGRIEDKIQKKLYAARLTPGLEDIKTEAISGDNGLILIERAPFGLIASIEPATHPGSCVINHAISMVAAGNSIIFLPHPKGLKTTQYLVRLFNAAIQEAGGPEDLLVVGDKVSLENLDLVLSHPAVDLVVATGGPEVVNRALRNGKKAIAAGPGNPPVVVDETVKDLDYAARCIVDGAAFDNTVLCIAEKVIIAVEAIAAELIFHLQNHGAYLVQDETDKEKLMRTILPDGKHFHPDLIGRDATVILKQAGIDAPDSTRIALMECPPEHPLVQEEQLLPVLPLVRVPDFDAALELAARVEHGFKHTAIIHSQDAGRITVYARRLRTDITVVNASSAAGLNIGGEGHFSHTIASPTGEGICTPRTYTREQRTVIVGALRTVD
ncbi:Aldehyde/histidinol dehydrogenase [Moorella glycerini]|uniref:Succinate-semialdehyde dehydrogenase n=1 Tax=Neomoorella stamsii TaxID=1266720 RepID=A0A9X7J0R3_9FIRM|nr:MULTISPECIES: aldehyde dehydrogenase [Moorella]PRR68626.1 Succinate-semialdehyde dehydrogenase [Moorella stamsii]CEP69035.1 Aldehyde/histidinol dehydrogenase [Moorella glycerini]